MCFTKLAEHFGATRCLECEANWQELGISLNLSSNANIVLNLGREACSELVSSCYDFVQTSEEMNANAVFYIFVLSAVNLKNDNVLPENGNFNSIQETDEELRFLTAMNAEFLSHIPDTTFFQKMKGC